MENMNENVVMNAEVDAAVDMESTASVSPKKVVGGVVIIGLAAYGAYKLGKKLVEIGEAVHENRKAKKAAKAKDYAVETTCEDITD